jgi:F-type H+/Na+-transporting ATPase subunit alpha
METFEKYLEKIGEYGVVREVRHPIAIVSGLPLVKPNELVLFDNGQWGQAFMLDKDAVEILVFSSEPVREGMQVVRTEEFISVPVGEELLGQIIDPLGRPMANAANFVEPKLKKDLDQEVHKLASRCRIKDQLLTGVSLIDTMIPLGKGQRELIIGDRKTGKSSFLLSTIKTQIEHGTIVIYAGVARKKSDLKLVQEFLAHEGLTDKVIMVCSTAHDSPSLIYITPYAAMTIAEYFRDQEKDVLIVIDDLSSHAKFYREVSLLAKRFPGRESYPGDIFYVHAKLVERAGKFFINEERTKTGSITCLPVMEIVESDLASYIATNLMGMTDGHIFFDSNSYNEGKRPAVNIPLSVTRVGKQTLSKLRKEINTKMNSFLASYTKMESYSHFGAELSDEVKAALARGANLYHLFDQHYSQSVPISVQVVLFGLIWVDALNDRTKDQIHEFRKKMIQAVKNEETSKYFEELIAIEKLDEFSKKINEEKEKLFQIIDSVDTTLPQQETKEIQMIG